MLGEELDFELDEIDVTLEVQTASSQELTYPHLFLGNLLLRDQIRGLVEDPPADLLVVDAYGEKKGELVYIGKVELSATNILRMKYLNVDVKFYKKAQSDPIDFSTAESLVSIIKTLRGSDAIAVDDSDFLGDSTEQHEGVEQI